MENSLQAQKMPNKVIYYKGGPYQIEGPCTIIDSEGNEIIKEGKIFLCRCGQSGKKPFCDGTHKKYDFDK